MRTGWERGAASSLPPARPQRHTPHGIPVSKRLLLAGFGYFIAGAIAELVAAGKIVNYGMSEAAEATIRRAHACIPSPRSNL